MALAGTTTTIDNLHSDIVSRALRHMDGPTLAAASCSSPLLRSLAADPALWRDVCLSTWPSLRHPQLARLLSGAHRRFFSDSFPFLESDLPFAAAAAAATDHRQHDDKNAIALDDGLPSSIISAVDLYHRGAPIFSRVIETQTSSSWFLALPFRVDGLDRKDPDQPPHPALTEHAINPEDLTLSWVIIDPESRRAANVSSRQPVAVHWQWYTGGTLVRFAVVLKGCAVSAVVTCGGEEPGHVREVSLTVEDMDGVSVSGRESLGVLKEAMEGGRRGAKWEEEIKKNYAKYLERRRERREARVRREVMLDLCCAGFGALLFLIFVMMLAFR